MPDVDIKKEQVHLTSNGGDAAELTAAYNAAVPNTEQERSNQLLIHACNCDIVQCDDPKFQNLCSHMKRFLRVICWATHSERWRSYPIATVVIELFTFHALHCQALQCNVPMCRRLRG
ncbi:unnamed protein product [Peronospora destructor]|uniref:SWIM-type domain-containing protein n=1 Tax=Peronospora destructor TaxID=86335 RepID=A0AAV0U5V4_9STRA|nr:unnamed protein product [Peronospora destructor]